MNFFRKIAKKEEQALNSKDAAKERLHLVLMQDRANVSADFLELMKQEIIEVIKKYIDVDENAIDVRLTNKDNGDGTKGAPALYANIPIINLKDEIRQANKNSVEEKVENTTEKTKENTEEEKEVVTEEKEQEDNAGKQEDKEKSEKSKEIIHEESEKQEVTDESTEN